MGWDVPRSTNSVLAPILLPIKELLVQGATSQLFRSVKATAGHPKWTTLTMSKELEDSWAQISTNKANTAYRITINTVKPLLNSDSDKLAGTPDKPLSPEPLNPKPYTRNQYAPHHNMCLAYLRSKPESLHQLRAKRSHDLADKGGGSLEWRKGFKA